MSKLSCESRDPGFAPRPPRHYVPPTIRTALTTKEPTGFPSCARVAGGSAANVAKGLAHLHQAAGVRFVSQVGADDGGAAYREGLAAAGVEPLLLESLTGLPTSTCLLPGCAPTVTCMAKPVRFREQMLMPGPGETASIAYLVSCTAAHMDLQACTCHSCVQQDSGLSRVSQPS